MSDGSVRLMLPMQHCVILPPFQLQHNLPSCMYSFFVKDVVYQDLMAKYDLLHTFTFFGHFASFLAGM